MKNDPLKISGMHDRTTPQVFRNAASLRKNMIEPEMKLWEYLKTKPMNYKFRRQHPLGCYVLDFYCHKLRLSIELDGKYHLNSEQKNKDEERTAYVNSLGIREIRFKNEDVLNNLNETILQIQNELKEASL
jgi:very-short-patch-repair endonuclease